MLEVGGVFDGPEQKSQGSRLVDEKVLQPRGTGLSRRWRLTPLLLELTVSAA